MTLAKVIASSLAVLTASAADDCKYALQVMQLQDASQTFADDMSSMMSSMNSLMSQLTSLYPGAEYAISTFTDKPIPLAGYGPYGGYQTSGIIYDYCYRQETRFTSDPEVLSDGLSKVVCGAGADNPEDQMEAMMYAAVDKTVGWNREDYSADGRPIVRIIIQITDAYPHKAGDADSNIEWTYNYPRSYTNNDFSSSSTGGIGADDFCDNEGSNSWRTWCDPNVWPSVYPQWAQLFHKIDAKVNLTDAEVQAWLEGNATMGPAPMVNPIPHPGADWEPTRCHEVDYPSNAQVADTLVENNVFPVWLIAAPTNDQYLYENCPGLGYNSDIPDELQMCVKVLYDNILAELGVSGYVGVLSDNSENLVETIMTAIGEIVSEVCLTTTTTTTTPTTAVETTTPTTTVETTTPTTTVETTTPTTTVETTTPTTAEQTTPATTVETTTPTTAEQTTPATTVETTTPTTTVETTTPTIAEQTTPATTVETTTPTTVVETTTPTTVVETTTPTTVVETTTPTTVVETTTPTTVVETTNGPTPVIPDTGSTKALTTTSEDRTKTADTTTGSASTTTTDGGVPVPVPVPDVPADGGSSAAVIAGAAAGGAAAAAAIGFAAYKYIGAGMMKSSTAGTLAQVQQVDVPESPLEREAMEEVTMDMFQ